MALEFEIKPAGGSLTDTAKSDYYVPYNTYYHDNRLQYVLLATELQAAGLRPGDRIIAVKFQCGTSVPGRDIVNFRIRMQNTDITTSSSWVSAGWTTVFGPSTVSRSSIQANSWQQYNFVEQFVWDGRNLLIDTSRDDTGWAADGGMYVYAGLSSRACGVYHDSVAPWPYDGLTPDVLNIIPLTALVVDRVLTATLEPQSASIAAGLPAPHVVHNATAVTSPALIAQIAIPHQNLYLFPIVAPSAQISLGFIPPSLVGHARVAASGAAVSATMPRAAASAAVRVSVVPSVQADHRPPQVYARVLPFRDLRTKSKPIVYDQSGKRLAILENAFELVLTQEINGEDTLTFALPATDPKAVYVVPENRVQIEDAEYIIRRIEETSDDNGNIMSVYCEAPWYDLMIADVLQAFLWENTYASDPMYWILLGTGWSPGVVEITSVRTMEIDQTTNRLAALRKVTEIWGGELEFDTAARRVHLRKEIARRPGIVVATRKNMRSLQKITDTTNLITRLYAYGQKGLTISSVNSGKPYVENFTYTSAVRTGVWKDTRFVDPYALKERAEEILDQLSKPSVSYVVKAVDLSSLSGFDHERFRLGDYVIVYNEKLGEKIETRIVRWQYHVDEPWKTEIELSTRVPRLTDYIYDVEDRMTNDMYDIEYRLDDIEEKTPPDTPTTGAGGGIAYARYVPEDQTVRLMIPFRANAGWAIIHVTYRGFVSHVRNDAPVADLLSGEVYVRNSLGYSELSKEFDIVCIKKGYDLYATGSTTVYIPIEHKDQFNPGAIEVYSSIDYTYLSDCRSHYIEVVYHGSITDMQNGTAYSGNCGIIVL